LYYLQVRLRKTEKPATAGLQQIFLSVDWFYRENLLCILFLFWRWIFHTSAALIILRVSFTGLVTITAAACKI